MKVEDILRVLETEVAPVKLSADFCAKYGLYDNSGIILNSGKEVTGALFSLDLSEEAADKAVSAGYNLIVTHHPAIYYGIKSIDETQSPSARALAKCIKCGVSVISMHLNFDAAPEGIDYFLMRGLGGDNADILAPVEGGAYGRAYEVEETTLSGFVGKIKKEFATDKVIFYGDGSKTVKKVVSLCGAGCDDNAIKFAKSHCADVFVSSDLKHHEIAELVASGIAVVQLTHYATEAYGFEKIYNKIKGLKIPSSFFRDGRFV